MKVVTKYQPEIKSPVDYRGVIVTPGDMFDEEAKAKEIEALALNNTVGMRVRERIADISAVITEQVQGVEDIDTVINSMLDAVKPKARKNRG